MDSEITKKVSCYDFKEQLLSILRDDNIMNPKNLVFKSGDDPDFGGDQLKDIHDVEWYKAVYNYITINMNMIKYNFIMHSA